MYIRLEHALLTQSARLLALVIMGCPMDVAMMSYHGHEKQKTDWIQNIPMVRKTAIYYTYYYYVCVY